MKLLFITATINSSASTKNLRNDSREILKQDIKSSAQFFVAFTRRNKKSAFKKFLKQGGGKKSAEWRQES